MTGRLPEKPAKILFPSACYPFCILEKNLVIFSGVFPWGAQIHPPAYAASRLRPLALLFLITACPARVLIRTLKPWVRLRLVLLG